MGQCDLRFLLTRLSECPGKLTTATLYFFCGKMGAGKSTRAASLAAEKNAVLISEDDWLAQLYPGQIKTFEDYRLYSARLRPLVESLVQRILSAGTNVVLDFAANTEGQRKWFKTLYEDIEANGLLLYIKASDDVCLAQIAKRRQEQPERARFDNEEVFRQVNSFFQEPRPEEGFNIQLG